jgi:hypothetical protein
MIQLKEFNMPPFMLALQEAIPAHVRPVVDYVWANKDLFIKWPQKQLLLMPGTTRESYHKYDQTVLEQMKKAGIKPNTLSNGPALAVFALAGGERPFRASNKKQWTIHHIYDGQFPHSAPANSTHAVKNGDYFTDSAGLVAIHPVADALADEVPYFAWLLRYEAFLRYGFDPDNAFVG